jgi:hypothetical protein
MARDTTLESAEKTPPPRKCHAEKRPATIAKKTNPRARNFLLCMETSRAGRLLKKSF